MAPEEKHNPVEQAYWEGIMRMTGAERVQRVCSLFDSMVRMLSHRVRREHPDWSDRLVRMQVAAILYQSEPWVLEKLHEAGLP